jgi:hypothetical protein
MTPDLMPSAEYVDAYDAGWTDCEKARPRLLQATAFGLGLVVGMMLACVLILAGTPREAVITASPAVANVATSEGPSGPTTSMPASLTLSAEGGPVQSGPAKHGDPAALGTISGIATWYDAPTIRDAAAGPGLRVGHWRGRVVSVCASRCITVRLTDWCACDGGHLIDLDNLAFRELAPLSQGIVRVTVSTVGPARASRPTPPPTDVSP